MLCKFYIYCLPSLLIWSLVTYVSLLGVFGQPRRQNNSNSKIGKHNSFFALKLQRAYLLKGGIDVVIIMILQESDTAVEAEVKAHNENYPLGIGRGEMTQ